MRGSVLRGSTFHLVGADWHLINAIGYICLGLVGLELASVMGDEIGEPSRTVPRAAFWGGVLSDIFYMGATLAVLLALPRHEIGAVQGTLQGVESMAMKLPLAWVVPLVALVLTFAIAGTTSAWLSGSAQIRFVAGLGSYLPSSLGKIHRRYNTPYVALFVEGIVTCIFLAMSFAGSTVGQAYKVLLSPGVVLQLVPFLYMYGALIEIAARETKPEGRYGRAALWAAGISGFVTTALGMGVAFLPPSGAKPWLFELKMAGGCLFFPGLSGFFIFIYSHRASAHVPAPRPVN